MRSIIFSFAIFLSGWLMAQPPVNWAMEKSSFLVHENYGVSLVTDFHGNIYCAGQIYENATLGNSMLLKLDLDGNEMWTGLYKGAGAGGENKAVKVVQGASGNLYMTGQVSDREGDIAVWKYSPNGNMIWHEHYTANPTWDLPDEGYDIAIDAEENVYVIGIVVSTSGNGDDAMTLAYDSAGNTLWEKQYTGASDWDFPAAICAEANGNVYSTSGSLNFFGTGSRDMAILHYNKQGAEQWKAYYTGPSGHDYPKDIETDNKGNVWVCGQINTNNYDMGVARFNEFGTKVWSKTYDGSAGKGDTAFAVAVHADGSATVIGRSMEVLDSDTVSAMTVIHYNAQGAEQWNKQYFGPEDMGSKPGAIYVDTTTNIIYAAGTTTRANGQSDGILVRLTSAGVEQWMYLYDGTKFKNDGFLDVTTDRFGNVIATGFANGEAQYSDVLVVKLGDAGPTGIREAAHLDVRIFPNPTADVLTISGGRFHYELMSLSKQTLREGTIEQTGSIDLHAYPAGVYLLSIEAEDGTRAVKKVIRL